MQVEPYTSDYLDAIVQLSLRAWTPVFASIQQAIDADLYHTFYGEDWRTSQQKAVESVCGAENTTVWVAMNADSVVGFIAVKLDPEDNMGEIYVARYFKRL